jgi:hypothetical protein
MSDFIVVTGASGASALIRVSAIISMVQDREDGDLRTIEYTAGDKILRLFVKDTTEEIAAKIKWEAAE